MGRSADRPAVTWPVCGARLCLLTRLSRTAHRHRQKPEKRTEKKCDKTGLAPRKFPLLLIILAGATIRAKIGRNLLPAKSVWPCEKRRGHTHFLEGGENEGSDYGWVCKQEERWTSVSCRVLSIDKILNFSIFSPTRQEPLFLLLLFLAAAA